MLWITIIFAAMAAWAVLSLVAVDHSDRMARLRARLRESEEQAARREHQQHDVPVIGGPPTRTSGG